MLKYNRMIRAVVKNMGIVLNLDSPLDNPSPDSWNALLDALKSQYIPSFYQYGKRMHVDVSPEGKHRAVIYFTSHTVSVDEAIAILKNFNISIADVRENTNEQ